MWFFKKREKNNKKIERKRKNLTVEDMIRLEKKLMDFQKESQSNIFNEENPADKLKLKVEYVDNIGDDIEAVLEPIDDNNYLGLIRVDTMLQQQKFAYIHEIIHYIFDVGIGQKVTNIYTRRRKGKTNSLEEQETNYLTAAAILDAHDLQRMIKKYDESRPKLDEIQFVRDLQGQYGQNEETVLRRISEVRRLEGKI